MKNSENIKFYRCSVCGNLIVKLEDSGVCPQCCGRDMELLVPNTVDAVEEKHIPIWKMDGCKVIVNVGNIAHPQTPEHHIQWIILETNCGYYMKHIKPDEAAETVFKLCKSEDIKGVYSYCNLHGLWKGANEGAEYECPLCEV